MRVVHRQPAHPQHAVQRAGALIAVHVGDLGQPDRQIAVAALLARVHEDVHRAVHRLHPIAHVLGLAFAGRHRGKLVLGIQGEVPGSQEQLLAGHVRRVDQLIAALENDVLDEAAQLEVDHRPFGVPQDQPGTDVPLHREQVEVLADDAVIALAGFLEPPQVALEIVLREPGSPVNALQHLAALVAAPIRAGGVQQLEVLDGPSRRDVRATTQIHERTIRVDRDHFVLLQIVDALELQRIVREAPLGLGAIYFLAHERIVRGRHLAHLRFDLLQVFGRERRGHFEVVVKAVLDRRPEADPGVREQLPHGGGQHVRRGVAQDVEGLRIAIGEQRHRHPVGQRT